MVKAKPLEEFSNTARCPLHKWRDQRDFLPPITWRSNNLLKGIASR